MKIKSQITSQIDQAFGSSLQIDVVTGMAKILECEFFIHNWIFDLVDRIGMKILDGNLLMKWYKGRDITTEGWSCMGFLDCSSISMHTSPYNSRIYLDIFSCKPIDLKVVNDFITETIKPIKIDFVMLNR
jgi:S-adenosylmethionine/arginine decarboxylase-like enzyme